MGKPFRGCHISHTDDFEPWKKDKIRGWIEHNGGLYSPKITPQVTHLLCSAHAWKQKCPLVVAALKMKTITIVKLDWLEDSLLNLTRRQLKTTKYEYHSGRQQKTRSFIKARAVEWDGEDAAKSKKRKAAAIEKAGNKFDQQCHKFIGQMKEKGYHPYTDSTNFTYLIHLLRSDIAQERVERYRLKVHYAPFWSYNCPVPLYYFPRRPSSPFSSHPVALVPIPASHSQSGANPPLRLRVPVLRSWAQCLQLFESDALPHTYACSALYATPGIRDAQEGTVAPIGSSWAFAWSAFCKFFKAKVNVSWDARETPGVCSGVGGNDGSSDHFRYVKPFKKNLANHKMDEGRQRTRSMTIVVNSYKSSDEDKDAKAPTPKGGW